MSLNRCEQLLYEYVEKHPEERQYWMYKVRSLAGAASDVHEAAFQLDAQLWTYFRERAGVVPQLKEFAAAHGLTRTSMRNLAELLLRLWAPPRPKRPAASPAD